MWINKKYFAVVVNVADDIAATVISCSYFVNKQKQSYWKKFQNCNKFLTCYVKKRENF